MTRCSIYLVIREKQIQIMNYYYVPRQPKINNCTVWMLCINFSKSRFNLKRTSLEQMFSSPQQVIMWSVFCQHDEDSLWHRDQSTFWSGMGQDLVENNVLRHRKNYHYLWRIISPLKNKSLALQTAFKCYEVETIQVSKIC